MLNGHGNAHANINIPINIDFSSNIWYKGLNANLHLYLQKQLANITNYPEVDASGLQAIIAKSHKLNPEQVCVTNGATEAFYLIAHAFKDEKSAVFYPSFAEYNDAASLYNHSVEYISNDELDVVNASNSNLVWIGNPNNPDGKIIPLEDIRTLLHKNPNKVFVIDEAYAEVCDDFVSAIGLIDSYHNLIVVKSTTKQCMIPGLRLGYFLSNAKLTQHIAAFRMPWSVNTLALKAGKYIFKYPDNFIIDTKELLKESISFQKDIQAIDGVEVCFSNTNYFLCSLMNKKAVELQDFLINNYGILIRDASNFKGLDASYFRLAIQGEDNNLKCINAIKKFVAND